MWIKRTEAVVAEEQRRQRRSRLSWALLPGAFFFLVVLFLRGTAEAARRGEWTVPADELLRRVPIALLAGGIIAVICYRAKPKPPLMICPQCEATKHHDGVPICSCGGRFEMIETMKYVSQPHAARGDIHANEKQAP